MTSTAYSYFVASCLESVELTHLNRIEKKNLLNYLRIRYLSEMEIGIWKV